MFLTIVEANAAPRASPPRHGAEGLQSDAAGVSRRGVRPPSIPHVLVWLALSAPSACDGGDDGATAAAPDLKGDRAGSLAFREIDPARPLAAADRKTVLAALARLSDVAQRGTSGRQRKLATETLARIVDGHVMIGSVDRARGTDLWHMCLDLGDDQRCPTSPPTDPAWAGDDALRRALADDLDGYTWGNRMYFRFGAELDATSLASTLVHEVNHVLNRSECMYYADYFTHEVEPTFAWLEEYRAFVSECVLARGSGATVSRCDTWAARQIVERGYDMTPDLAFWVDDASKGSRPIAESLFADDGRYGWLAPLTAHWPRAFAECETPEP